MEGKEGTWALWAQWSDASGHPGDGRGGTGGDIGPLRCCCHAGGLQRAVMSETQRMSGKRSGG